MIGLGILLLVAGLSFFGFYRNFFARERIKMGAAFLFIILFTFGAILPQIEISRNFSFNIGGFIVPLVFFVFIMAVTNARKSMLKFTLSFFLIMSVSVLVLAFMPRNVGFTILSVVVLGIAVAILAFLITGEGSVTMASVAFGVVLGNVISSVILYAQRENPVSLGTNGVFDTIIFGIVLGCALVEIRKYLKRRRDLKAVNIRELQFEMAADSYIVPVVEDEFGKHF